MKTVYITVIVSIFSLCMVNGQDSTKTAIAKKGDGIIKLLRSHGMNVTKYYERFLKLNEGNIRNGSELHLGRTYYLPDAPDSFENMGRKIQVPNGEETAIFSKELYHIKKKDNSLENTVYYIILDEFDGASNASIGRKATDESIAKNMAKELMSRGAKIYIVQSEISTNANLGEYTAAINRSYLKNNGKYQRLLVLDLNIDSKKSTTRITIAHHDKSKEGQKLAASMSKVFQKQNVLKKSSKAYAKVFTDKVNLYLAKNALPIMTFVAIGEASHVASSEKSNIKNVNLYDLLTTGILQDYTNLNFEDQD